MKKMLLLFFIISSWLVAGDTLTVAEGRAATLGDTIVVTGTVNAPSWGGVNYSIQDHTGGIVIYSYDLTKSLAVGDSVAVRGALESYNNLLEIVPSTDSDINIIESGKTVTPQYVTLSGLLSNAEDFESELIRVNNIEVVSGAWSSGFTGSYYSAVFSDDDTVTTIGSKLDSDTDLNSGAAPTGKFDLTAVVGQYQDNYQLLPRYYADLDTEENDFITFAEARATALGTNITLQGFVTTPDFSGSSTEIGMQDATGGLVLYKYGDAAYGGIVAGDFVEVHGELDEWNGKLEILPDSAQILQSNSTLPEPILMTLRDLLETPEKYEGMLVKILNVTYTGTWPASGADANLTIEDPSDTTLTMRIDKDTEVDESSAPVGAFNLTGIVGQYDSSDPPYDEGYQILPRYASDIAAFANQAPDIVSVTRDPALVLDGTEVEITATITDDGNFTASLVYVTDSADTLDMTAGSGDDEYVATIPGQTTGTLVKYLVTADDGEFISTTDTLTYLVLGGADDATPIYDIQYNADATTDSSLMNGQQVAITGVVTAEFWGSDKNRYLHVQDSLGLYSGVIVFEYGGWDGLDINSPSGITNSIAEGDSVLIYGTVTEYYGLTEVTDVTSASILGKSGGMAPLSLTVAEANDESAEGVLVEVNDVVVVDPDLGFGEWSVTDGTDTMVVDDKWDYYYWPEAGDTLLSIVGVVDYNYGAYKLQPRLARDVVEKGVTRIQRVQQVLYSDLLKTGRPTDSVGLDLTSDLSYLYEDTVTLEGIVTMPTGLSYAGAGIKFIYQDENGGPWSGILSYDPDSTAFPILFEGDRVRATGYVYEYSTDHGNMTELFITENVDILGYGLDTPPVSHVATGDLRWPETAEQWGNVMVRVSDLIVTNTNPAGSNFNNGMFAVDDGTGEVWVDHDSDSIQTWWEIVGPPQDSTEMDSITGWVYHHFDTYSDTGVSTYKLAPLYVSDIAWEAPVVAIDDNNLQPGQYALHENYPNPFNPSTRIRFDIARDGNAKLIVYDILGRQVRTLVNRQITPGTYTVNWDGKNNSGQLVGSGMYFYRLIINDFVSTHKMMLIR